MHKKATFTTSVFDLMSFELGMNGQTFSHHLLVFCYSKSASKCFMRMLDKCLLFFFINLCSSNYVVKLLTRHYTRLYKNCFQLRLT